MTDGIWKGGLYDFAKPITSDITLTAHWTDTSWVAPPDTSGDGGGEDDARIRFDSNGGTRSTPSMKTEGASPSMCTMMRAAPDSTGGFILENQIKAALQKETAAGGTNWTLVQVYTVVFDSQGGTAVKTQYVVPGDLNSSGDRKS